jgi:sulfide:quinone oxidoreductase
MFSSLMVDRKQAVVVLVSDRPEFVFKPYLNYVLFGLQPGDLQFDLAELAEARGFVRVAPETRQVEGRESVYAVGDASNYPVKQGFLALLQADAAAEHFAAELLGEEPAFAFEPRGTWLMKQFDQALLAEGALEKKAPHARTGAPESAGE